MESESKEQIIVELSTSMGYTPEIIELLYDFTNGDKEGINKILSSLHKNILLVKVNFECQALNRKGFLYFAYNAGKKEMLEKGFFAYAKGYVPIDLDADWDDVKEVILKLKSDGEFDQKMVAFFDREMNRELFLRELKKITGDMMGSHKFLDLVETLLGRALNPVFYHKNFSMEVNVEMLDPLIFFKPLEEKHEEVEEEPDEELEEENVIVSLKVYPVLDPINGKLVKELEAGDYVLFELKDEREAAAYIVNLLKEKNVSGLTGQVKSYKSLDQDTVKLEIEFAPGIKGESIVPKTVMLKRMDHHESQDQLAEGETENFIRLSYKSFITGIIIIMFIIALFLFMYR